MSPDQITQGKELAAEYLKKYGTYATADHVRDMIRDERPKCARSRVGSTCNKVWAFWTTCNVNQVGIPERSCMLLGSVGLPGLAGLQPADLKTADRNLIALMDRYKPGRVIIGEFRVIEVDD